MCAFRGTMTLAALSFCDPRASAQVTVSQLRTYSLEELMGMDVTSVSRKAEPFYETAGAVAVLTGSEIQQIGSRNLADALRYVPGLEVARVDFRTWAISSRGFNQIDSNKMLVLMDGRTVYSPLFSGVAWDVQDTFLPDLDRIEVIRGPGATMWGSNAVNGVISMTTKDARYTQGGLVTAGLGVEEKAFAGVRYGGEVPGKIYYRVYAQTTRRDDLLTTTGQDLDRQWSVTQTGFRVDSAAPKEHGSFTFQGDYYHGKAGASPGRNAANVYTPLTGGNLLLRGTKPFANDMELSTQVYFDYLSRSVYQQFGEVRRTYDFDTQLRFSPWEHHDVVTGFDYRYSKDQTRTGNFISFVPVHRGLELGSAFVQDEIRWHEEKYGLIIGSKFEYHASVGLEIQPSIRLALRNRRSTLWASVSRALRTPSRFDEDARVGILRGVPQVYGSHSFQSESVVAYEIGYRAQHFTRFTWDASLFFNDYDNLRSQEPIGAGRNPSRLLSNRLMAETYGAEVSLKWQPIRHWRLQASYSYLGENFHLAPDSRDITNHAQEANDPKNSANLRSHLVLGRGVEWDLGLRYVSSLPNPVTSAYLATDTRLAWRYRGQWEFALVGQNIFDNHHAEFGARVSDQVQRGYYGSITWEF